MLCVKSKLESLAMLNIAILVISINIFLARGLTKSLRILSSKGKKGTF